MIKVRSCAGRVLGWVMVFSVVLGAGALIVLPKATGARPLTVLSGSMTGTYDVGDVVIVRPVDTDELEVGDVITFQPVSDDPNLTTHRIVALAYGNNETHFVTQGDANNAVDPAPVKPAQVNGEVWYSVPKVGFVATSMAGGWLRTVTDLAAIGLLLYGGFSIMSGLVGRRRRAASTEDVEAVTDSEQEKVEVSA